MWRQWQLRVINCLANNMAGAAARPPIADTKADNRRGRDGHFRTHALQHDRRDVESYRSAFLFEFRAQTDKDRLTAASQKSDQVF